MNNLDGESELVLRCLRGGVIVLLAMVFSIAGSCSFNSWQHESTERACIASGRAMFAGSCGDPVSEKKK